jgi:hypothetical protein
MDRRVKGERSDAVLRTARPGGDTVFVEIASAISPFRCPH